ncbi:MAG: cell division protein ZapA [Thermodesulfobacteriota bacterium]
MHKRVTVDILGHQYSIKTDGDEQYIQRIAEYVNAKSREVMEATHTVTTLDLIMKVAINLADELFQERSRRETLHRTVEEEARRISQEISAHLKGEVTSTQ